jgi:hypothetical protein
VFPVFPCLLALGFGWAIWDRWLAQTATLLVWALFLFPFAVAASLGARWELEKSGGMAASFVVSLALTEVGIRLRDRFERYRRARGG